MGAYTIFQTKSKTFQFILFHNNIAKKKNTTNIPQVRKSLKKVRLLYRHTQVVGLREYKGTEKRE